MALATLYQRYEPMQLDKTNHLEANHEENMMKGYKNQTKKF